MTKGVQRVAITMFVLFGLLFANLNYVQVLRSDDLANDDRNARLLIREYETRRGLILSGDRDTVLADTEETDGRLRFRRVYERPETFAHITGYHSVNYGRTHLESTYNDELAGRTPQAFGRNMADFLAGRERSGDNVITTVLPEVQQVAMERLDGVRGAVVAVAPRSGAVLALASNPTFDPGRVAAHDTTAAAEYKQQLDADDDQPLRNRAVSEWYAPGSTFKLVTGAAGLEGGVTADATFDDPVRLSLPQTTATIGNFGGGPCAGGGQISFAEAMRVSCNTTFAQMGLDVGEDALIAQAERFGFNAQLTDELTNPLASRMPGELNPPQTAQAAIGEFDVRATPLQMALVAGAIGNDGVLMQPRLVRAVEDERGDLLAEFTGQTFTPPGEDNSQAVSPRTAQTLRDMMVGVVESGTGTNAQVPGTTVAGKTGTAQQPEGAAGPTVWFAGFAPADSPRVAIAVVVEEGGAAGSGATGGGVAAPIARDVLQAALEATD